MERCALLQEEGADVRFAYFPCNAAVVSFEILLNDGKPVGTTLIGREGAVGGFFSHGYLPAYAQARVLLPGNFLRVALSELEKVKVEIPSPKARIHRVFRVFPCSTPSIRRLQCSPHDGTARSQVAALYN